MKSRSKIVLCLSAMLVVAGCASTKVTDRQEIVTRATPAARSHLGVRLRRHARRCAGRLRACRTAVSVQHAPNCRADRDRP